MNISFCGHFRYMMSVILLTLALASCGPDETVSSESDIGVSRSALTTNQTWWNNLTQYNKNTTVLTRAYQDLGRTTTMNCKQWVQKVVFDATKGVLVVPTTVNNGDSFYWNRDNNWRSFTSSSCYWPQNLQPGMILQMQSTRCTYPGATSTGPHTAIVISANANGVKLIESNWCATNTICERYLSTADFRKWFVDCTGLSRCTAYRVGNWQ